RLPGVGVLVVALRIEGANDPRLALLAPMPAAPFALLLGGGVLARGHERELEVDRHLDARRGEAPAAGAGERGPGVDLEEDAAIELLQPGGDVGRSAGAVAGGVVVHDLVHLLAAHVPAAREACRFYFINVDAHLRFRARGFIM